MKKHSVCPDWFTIVGETRVSTTYVAGGYYAIETNPAKWDKTDWIELPKHYVESDVAYEGHRKAVETVRQIRLARALGFE